MIRGIQVSVEGHMLLVSRKNRGKQWDSQTIAQIPQYLMSRAISGITQGLKQPNWSLVGSGVCP